VVPAHRIFLSKDEVIALIQHEVASSLQRILIDASEVRSKVERVLRTGDETEDWRLSLRDIDVRVNDLGRLLTLLPQLEAGEPINVHPVLLQRVVPSAALERWRGGRLHVLVKDMPDALPPVQADVEMLRLVMHNLLANAEKYASVDLPVEISTEMDATTVKLSVRDYGPGIRIEQLESVFGFFVRGESGISEVPGMGVGLALCRLLMNSMGGRITAHRPDGPGLQVTLELGICGDEESFL